MAKRIWLVFIVGLSAFIAGCAPAADSPAPIPTIADVTATTVLVTTVAATPSPIPTDTAVRPTAAAEPPTATEIPPTPITIPPAATPVPPSAAPALPAADVAYLQQRQQAASAYAQARASLAALLAAMTANPQLMVDPNWKSAALRYVGQQKAAGAALQAAIDVPPELKPADADFVLAGKDLVAGSDAWAAWIANVDPASFQRGSQAFQDAAVELTKADAQVQQLGQHQAASPASAAAAATAPPAPRTAWVGNTGGNGVYLRASPNPTSRMSPWRDGTPMVLVGAPIQNASGTWQGVQAPDGEHGYLPAQYLVATPPT